MCEPCELLPPLSLCVRGLLQAFDQHASKDGGRQTLSKKELRGLMRREMGPEIQKATAQRKLGELFDLMDRDGDQKMDFPEFMGALGVVACMVHDRGCEMPTVCRPPISVCEPCGPCGPFGRPEEPISCVFPTEPMAPPCEG